VINAINSIQWCLYYPGVLNIPDLQLSPASGSALERSLSAYAEGDLLAALKAYPPSRSGIGARDAVYRAGLFLVVGQIDKAQRLLRNVSAEAPGHAALRTLIAAVTLQPKDGAATPQTASDWVAESYYLQSRSDLPGALAAAQRASELDASFGFAWTRIAELQFSFGRVPQAQQAMARSLTLAPRNPAAHTLQGFLLAAENRIEAARASFEQAIAIDGALGNAWLGRGLCLIRRGAAEEGRRDLQTAAALEPNRSIFHSYLGKGFSNAGNEPKARLELERAKQLDPRDPTPWLYSAIQNRQDSRINEAVRDLERSIELNNNRSVYRSRFLLEQDRAVRSANLAAIYQEAGMEEVSLREATRGVDADYSNASSHLFLANSYNAVRDPKRINLRYETAWFNELLLANLLAPVGGGPLSQFISEQEYSKLFEADRLGFSSTTHYFTTGELRETASQYGIFGNISYALDAELYHDSGQRPNNDIDRWGAYAQVKIALTPRDSLFLQTRYQEADQGDILQRYDQTNFAPGTRFREEQHPGLALAGYHHEWAPGIHTLLLAGRLAADVSLDDRNRIEDIDEYLRTGVRPQVSRSLIFTRDAAGTITGGLLLPLDLRYHSAFTTYTGEVNQIWETDRNTAVAGARFQAGEFQTRDRLDNPPEFAGSFFTDPAALHDFSSRFDRQSFYLYDTFRPVAGLSVTGGISYDRLHFPTNYRNPPITSDEATRSRVSPKAGIIWNPVGNLVFRGVYARSLGGVSFDRSVSLEPNQVAGFNQLGRSVISESVVGSVAAPKQENAGILVESKFRLGTYVSMEGTLVRSDVDRRLGTFDAVVRNGRIVAPITASSTPQRLEYEEKNLLFTANQLLGDRWSFGARYQVSASELETIFKEVPRAALPGLAQSQQRATLHQAQLFALYNHPSGFFGRAEVYGASQSNGGYSPDAPGDEVVQFNLHAGYRFRRNYGDISVGLLNAGDEDYNLNPLNYYNELPRERSLGLRVRLNF
jgi:Flp pilus assembly protein TadD